MIGPVTKTCTLAIDVGGTFTDITFTDAATGALWVAKTPSTPGDLSTGFITAALSAVAIVRSNSRNWGSTSDESETSTPGYSSARIACIRCSCAGLA